MRYWQFIFMTAVLYFPAGVQADSPSKTPSTASTPAVKISLSTSVIQWNKCSNSDGLTIYWSKVEGSPVIAFRGEGIVDAPLEKVASVIIDTTRGTEWISSLVESRVVRENSSTEFIEYDHVGIPFPFTAVISDRDFVSQVNLEADPQTKRMTVKYDSMEEADVPPIKKYTRGIINCEFKLVPMSIPEETYVEAEVFTDPKGNIPKWLVNFFQQSWPQDTFEGLRKQVKKSDIKILPIVENLLQKPAGIKIAQKK